MAVIKPFKGLRFTEKDLNTLVCPPYDIISPAQREGFLAANPHNIVRLELPTGADGYAEAGGALGEWMRDGVLRQDESEGIYVYEMEFSVGCERHSVKGFVSLVKLEEFSAGVILPHEETLSKAKDDRFKLMSATGCSFSQIYSLYMDSENVVAALLDAASEGAPDMEVTDGDGTIHRCWIVDDARSVSAISAALAEKKLYIADGHHRYETALNYRRKLVEGGENLGLCDYVCMMLVNMENDGLVVFPTHRVVNDVAGFDKDELLEDCTEWFDVFLQSDVVAAQEKLTECYQNGKTAFILYTGGTDYNLLVLKNEGAVKRLSPRMSGAYCGLDVSALHTLILERILNIDRENMAGGKTLTYTRSAEEAVVAVKNGANCCFLLNPTRVGEIRDVALEGEKMPQKSTYFHPKLITGLVMNKFK